MALFRPRGREPGRPSAELSAPALSRILELIQQVGAAADPAEVLVTALDAAIDLTEAERGWILIERSDTGLEVALARRRGGEPLENPLVKISRTVVEQALGEDRGLCVDEAREDAQLGGAPSVAEMRLRAVLCVPFRLEQARGVFYLDNRFASGVFGEESLRMLSAFTAPVAMLLRHSELERRLADSADVLAHANRELDVRLRDRTAEVARLEGLAQHLEGSDRNDPFPEILGTSRALRRALDSLLRAAEGDFPVVLRGESGTGKDLAARALHRVSARRDEPLVAVSLAGLNPDLLEAELFGVRKGAYTGADEDRDGLVGAAGAGTLYFDALDALPIELQPKLLRVLEDGSYRPVGGGAERNCGARIIAACRRDLADAVREGSFREDLYYRVRVLEIVLPPLRERRGDIPLLFRHFLEAAAARSGVEAPRLEAAALERMKGHAWPGNVRELANLATRFVAYGGELPEEAWEGLLAEEEEETASLRAVSDRHLLRTLEEAGGNKAEAARRLGISRRTLYNRLKSLDVDGV